MKKEELFQLIGEANEQKVAAAGKAKSRPVWVKWGALAACLCLVIVGSIFLFSEPPEIINGYHIGVEAKYVIPAPGEYFCYFNVTAAREQYAGQDVQYLLAFDIFKPDVENRTKSKRLSEEETNAEYQRLMDLGYELYITEYFTYQGYLEKVYRPVVVGLFSEKELATFSTNPAYSYLFYFVNNGDGSFITFDGCQPLTIP